MISQRVLAILKYDEGRDDVRSFVFSIKRDSIFKAIAKVVEALETYTQDSPHTRASKALNELERALKECGV